MRKDLLIDQALAGERLDRALSSRLDNFSRRQARELIESGRVFVNGKRTKTASRKIQAGDRIVVHGPKERSSPSFEPEVLFEDDSIIVLNKPPRIVVNETETSSELSLVEHLRESGRGAFTVHRLDRDTTGVIVFAKQQDVARELSELFARREAQKDYLAVTVVPPPVGTIEDAIGRDPKSPRTRRVHREGKEAITEVVRVVRLEGRCLVLLRPKTGRTHQIRVHLAHQGAPLLGDKAYGGPTAVRIGEEIFEVERPLLHAYRLRLGQSGMSFEAPIPKDFLEIAGPGVALLDGSQ